MQYADFIRSHRLVKSVGEKKLFRHRPVCRSEIGVSNALVRRPINRAAGNGTLRTLHLNQNPQRRNGLGGQSASRPDGTDVMHSFFRGETCETQ